jgi:hypothetical protein
MKFSGLVEFDYDTLSTNSSSQYSFSKLLQVETGPQHATGLNG